MKFALAAVFSARNKQFLPAVFAVILIFVCALPLIAQNETQPADDPVKLFNQGQDAHEKGDFQTAIKFYDEALKANPAFPEAEYQRGAAFVSLGKRDEAEKSFRRAIELRENWTLPMTALGSILAQKNNFAEAEKVLTKAIELDAQNPEAYVSLAELYLQTKPAPEILKNFLTKLQNFTLQPKSSASIWAARGAIELVLQEKEAARKSLNTALTINPNDDFALTESAEFFLESGDFARAVETAEKLVKVSPNSANAKILLARVYAKDGRTADALKILDNLDSANAEVAALRNSLSINDSQDAAALEKQLEKEPKNADILSRLCNLSRVSNPQQALDYCRRAAEIEPNNLNHIIAYGAALVQAKQFENAISLFGKVLQIAPDNYTARANLATALFESRRYQDAKTEYEWIAKAKPDLAITYYLLGISHDQMQEYAEASENYKKFLSLADDKQNRLEIDKVNLRLPLLEKLIKQKGKK
ncbi:MAG: tetratricopeptide repeat protein [Pyrinomonadaceae bacterium]